MINFYTLNKALKKDQIKATNKISKININTIFFFLKKRFLLKKLLETQEM